MKINDHDSFSPSYDVEPYNWLLLILTRGFGCQDPTGQRRHVKIQLKSNVHLKTILT